MDLHRISKGSTQLGRGVSQDKSQVFSLALYVFLPSAWLSSRYVNSLIRPETAPRPGKEELVQEALGGPREVDWNGEGTAIRSGAREVQLRPGPEKKHLQAPLWMTSIQA